MTRNNLKVFSISLILISFLFSNGCRESFKEITSDRLEAKWLDSKNHTAVSWWYLGDKEGFHFIVEKWPLSTNEYKVTKKEVTILVDKPMKFSLDRKDWLNLKKDNLVFHLHNTQKEQIQKK